MRRRERAAGGSGHRGPGGVYRGVRGEDLGRRLQAPEILHRPRKRRLEQVRLEKTMNAVASTRDLPANWRCYETKDGTFFLPLVEIEGVSAYIDGLFLVFMSLRCSEIRSRFTFALFFLCLQTQVRFFHRRGGFPRNDAGQSPFRVLPGRGVSPPAAAAGLSFSQSLAEAEVHCAGVDQRLCSGEFWCTCTQERSNLVRGIEMHF